MASPISENPSTPPSSPSSQYDPKPGPRRMKPLVWNGVPVNEEELLSLVGHNPDNKSNAYSHPASEVGDSDGDSWKNAPNRKCHASFGDSGTTATVGAFGQLLQLSSFLGAGSSGMFSADHSHVWRPYFVCYRASQLENLSFLNRPINSSDEAGVYGLRFPGLAFEDNAKPELKWTQWRWPRHEYSPGTFRKFPNLRLTIQWMVHQGTILQQCILENDSKDFPLSAEFSKSMLIRDLDHLDPQLRFNLDETADHDSRPGPGGYGWICAHKFPEIGHERRTAEEHSGHPSDDDSPDQDRMASGSACKVPQEEQAHQEHEPPHPEPEQGASCGVSVTCSVAIDGKVQKFEHTPSPKQLPLTANMKSFKVGNTEVYVVEVITAYKISLLPRNETDWEDHVIPWSVMKSIRSVRPPKASQRSAQSAPTPSMHPVQGVREKGLLGVAQPSADAASLNDKQKGTEDCFEPHRGLSAHPFGTPGNSPLRNLPDSPHNHLNFAVQRNLEHILSVCAVQMPPKKNNDSTSGATLDALDGVNAVALTCGDMSGHRICWSASFFAFRFLVEYYKVCRDAKEYQNHFLHRRIRDTCLGHLKWLRSIQQYNGSQQFEANYWVTGKPMNKPQSSSSWVAEKSFLDTAFQILKAADCVELLADSEKGNQCAAGLKSDWAPALLMEMQDSDKRKKYAWPHSQEEGINIYRLDTHVWIWRTLKTLETDNHAAWDDMVNKAGKNEGRIKCLRDLFSSNVVRREVSRRFTTENTVVKRCMLATTRSIRESRFMLHSRDTALHYEELYDFFESDSVSKELWKTTVRYQMYHTEYRDTTWAKTLRYALNIVLATQELSISSAPPNTMVREATDTLFRSSSPNGLFPGRMEKLTKEPVAAPYVREEDMESYYHACFEIPYILLKNRDRIEAAYRLPLLETPDSDLTSGPGILPRRESIPSEFGLDQREDEQHKLLRHLEKILSSKSKIRDLGYHEVHRDPKVAMRKAVPFDKLIDSSNIVKLDDEWLYKYPDFFNKPGELQSEDEGLEELKNNLNPQEDKSGQFELDAQTKRDLRYCIVDVGSSKRDEGKRKEYKPSWWPSPSDRDPEEILNWDRTAQNAKKRLLTFEMLPKQVALLCYVKTEESERLNLKDFFRRHSRYAKFTYDHCSMIRNYWESEFHLSYYQLLKDDENYDLRHGIAPPQRKPFPGRISKQVMRASASFRFSGDFFDRHWTCFVLDSSLRDPKHQMRTPPIISKREYSQRKVLEQRCLADILENMTRSAEEILEEVYTCLGADRKSGFFPSSIRTTKEYLSWSADWQDLEPHVQELHADLISSQDKIHQWEAREDDRGKLKPRWTSKDESKYRASILEIRREIKTRLNELQQLCEATKSLQDLCSNRLDKVREDLSFRNEQNIAMFTYVTVVFLPLGFAASVFSMSGPPEQTVAVNMVLTSIIALAITVSALMNTKSLSSVVENVSTSFKDLTKEARESSVLVLARRKSAEKEMKEMAANPIDTNQLHRRPSSEDQISWDLLFWTGYIFIELPSRSIVAACRALGWSHHDFHGAKTSDRADAPGITNDDSERTTGQDGVDSEEPTVPQIPAKEAVTESVSQADGEWCKTQEYFTKIARILLGFLMVPIFFPFWILQILCFYAWDTLTLLGELLHQGISHMSHGNAAPDIVAPESSLMNYLTNPPEKVRPLKKFTKHLQKKRQDQRQISTSTGAPNKTLSSPEQAPLGYKE